MRRDQDWARARFAEARVARLATVRADGSPRIVPIVFAVAGGVLLTAVDHKPKATNRLGRLADIATHPEVSLLVDAYSEDWTRLWWARADGVARIVGRIEEEYDIGPLVAKYDDYLDRAPTGPAIVVEVRRWSGWSASLEP